jgi:hypothetical protein
MSTGETIGLSKECTATFILGATLNHVYPLEKPDSTIPCQERCSLGNGVGCRWSSNTPNQPPPVESASHLCVLSAPLGDRLAHQLDRAETPPRQHDTSILHRFGGQVQPQFRVVGVMSFDESDVGITDIWTVWNPDKPQHLLKYGIKDICLVFTQNI